jgi:hypothetical protein
MSCLNCFKSGSKVKNSFHHNLETTLSHYWGKLNIVSLGSDVSLSWNKDHFILGVQSTNLYFTEPLLRTEGEVIYYKNTRLGLINRDPKTQYYKIHSKTSHPSLSCGLDQPIEDEKTQSKINIPLPSCNLIRCVVDDANRFLFIFENGETILISYDIKKGLFIVENNRGFSIEFPYESEEFKYRKANPPPYVWLHFTGYGTFEHLMRNPDGTSYLWWDGMGEFMEPPGYNIRIPQCKLDKVKELLNRHQFKNINVTRMEK